MNGDPDSQEERAFLAAARIALEAETRSLDGATVARLRAARLRALAAGARTRPALWLPVAAAAVAAVAIVAGLQILQAPAPQGVDADPIAALDDSYELYENLEFYEWMEAQADENHV